MTLLPIPQLVYLSRTPWSPAPTSRSSLVDVHTTCSVKALLRSAQENKGCENWSIQLAHLTVLVSHPRSTRDLQQWVVNGFQQGLTIDLHQQKCDHCEKTISTRERAAHAKRQSHCLEPATCELVVHTHVTQESFILGDKNCSSKRVTNLRKTINIENASGDSEMRHP